MGIVGFALVLDGCITQTSMWCGVLLARDDDFRSALFCDVVDEKCAQCPRRLCGERQGRSVKNRSQQVLRGATRLVSGS